MQINGKNSQTAVYNDKNPSENPINTQKLDSKFNKIIGLKEHESPKPENEQDKAYGPLGAFLAKLKTENKKTDLTELDTFFKNNELSAGKISQEQWTDLINILLKFDKSSKLECLEAFVTKFQKVRTFYSDGETLQAALNELANKAQNLGGKGLQALIQYIIQLIFGNKKSTISTIADSVLPKRESKASTEDNKVKLDKNVQDTRDVLICLKSIKDGTYKKNLGNFIYVFDEKLLNENKEDILKNTAFESLDKAIEFINANKHALLIDKEGTLHITDKKAICKGEKVVFKDSRIKNVQGLEHLQAAKSLTIYKLESLDLSKLPTQLEELNLYKTDLKNTEFLKQLNNLKKLDIYNCKGEIALSKFSMPKLEELKLNSITLTNPDELQKFTNLKKLVIKHCKGKIDVDTLPTTLKELKLHCSYENKCDNLKKRENLKISYFS